MRFLLSICVVALYVTNSNVMGNEEGVKAVTRSANTFASKFFKTIAGEQPGNLICSPLSASMVLSMAAYGARGNTEQEMRTGLALPADDNLAKAGFQSFIDSLKNYKQVELRLANKVFLAEKFTPKAEFTELTKTAFRSEAQRVNFANSVEASRTINAWCEGQTNNRIKDLISPDDVNSLTALVLVNAVYFKGSWARKFEVENTKPRPFHVDSPKYPKGTKVDVPTMYRYGNYKYGVLPEVSARFLEIPYKSEGENDKISMFVILPDQVDGLPSLVQNIEKVTIEKLLSGTHEDVHLYLPKFKIESTIPLNDPLKKMGMAEMFTDSANFTGISDLPLSVSKVIQKAFIEVNEEGSEAAAANAVLFRAHAVLDKDPVLIMDLDHPFVYAIIKSEGGTGIKLFEGQFSG